MTLKELNDELERLTAQFEEAEEELQAQMCDEDMSDSLPDASLLRIIGRDIAKVKKQILAQEAKIKALTQEIEALLEKVSLLRKSLYDARGQFISDPKTSWEIVKFRDEATRLNSQLTKLGGECMLKKIFEI